MALGAVYNSRQFFGGTGAANVYNASTVRCRLCADREQLESLAAASVTRGFTPGERARYLRR
jgi:hypothetical protein